MGGSGRECYSRAKLLLTSALQAPADASTWPPYTAAADQSIVLDATALDAKLSVESGLKQARVVVVDGGC